MDRLAEIEREWAYAENGSDKDDVQWLIAEVQRLRSNDEDPSPAVEPRRF